MRLRTRGCFRRPTAGECQLSRRRCCVITNEESRYFAANIPGKAREPLNFMGGMPMYRQKLVDEQNGGYQGFTFA